MNLTIKIAIASGKGGTGKTFISTNLFNVLQKKHYNITLVDCDAEEPNDREFISGKIIKSYEVTQEIPVINESACSYCGKCSEYCNYNAIFFLKDAHVIKILDELCHGCGACSFACEHHAISVKNGVLGSINKYIVSEKSTLIESRMKVGVYSPVSVIKKAIREASNSQITLLDSPPGTSCSFIQTVATADYVVLVTEPTPFGLSNLIQSVETLKILGKSCGAIINRASMGDDKVQQYLRLENIPLLMSIPFDRKIAACYSNGDLLTNQDYQWEFKFNQLYNTIIENYANCNH